MGLLYLVRHALTRPDPARNMAEWELDPAGAADLARLAALPVWAGAGQRIVCSSEPKARLTAEAIRAAYGLPPVAAYDELREIKKAGWTDRHDEVMADLFARPDEPALPGWETAAQAGARFGGCVARILAESAGADLVLVSHATVLSIYVAALLGQDRVQYEDWRSIGFPDYAVVDVGARRIIQPFAAWR
ncbi:MAG TPA: histidine phosphatase family protein [Symbiobacteriaceae bacterium]|nr:histidine phosphatase family protein [Symbiobacteriaceae bacterium]